MEELDALGPLHEGIEERVAHEHRAHRHRAVGETLRGGEDVRHRAQALRAERLAEPAEAGDHLVVDKQDAVARANLAQPLEIALRRHQHARRTGHRLDDHRGDGRRVMQRAKALEVLGELGAVRGLSPRKCISRQVVRMAQVVHAGYARAEGAPVVDDAADCHAAKVDAVIATLAPDQTEAAAFAARAVIGQRDLERRVRRFRARVGKEDARIAARREACETLRELESDGMPHLERRREIHFADLPAHRFDDFRPAVAGVHAP